jgi:hypothetical protein
MMDPLVDEYNKSDKGVNLKSLKVAETKAKYFLHQTFRITLVLALAEIGIKALMMI